MKPNAKFIVAKAIPLRRYNGPEMSEIKRGTVIYRTHGMYYMEGGLLDRSFQEDFDRLIEREERTGWNYLRPTTYTEYGL